MSATSNANKTIAITDPPFARALFDSPRWAWLWLIARVYIGYTWLSSGLGKLGNPAWTTTGVALKGFWTQAVHIPEAPASPPIAFGWYRSFIQFLLDGGHYVWFAKLVVAGELLVGIALILGAFAGLAAFFGAFLNWNFMMAGSASVNPLMFVITMFLILGWKTAGWWGLDRWLLPLMGTPWRPGRLFEKENAS